MYTHTPTHTPTSTHTPTPTHTREIERRERGDLTKMNKMVTHRQKIDRQDLVTVTGGVDRRRRKRRGYSKKVVKSQCLRDVRKYSFPHRTGDVWKLS